MVACLVSSITSRRSGNELALLSRKSPRSKHEREAESLEKVTFFYRERKNSKYSVTQLLLAPYNFSLG